MKVEKDLGNLKANITLNLFVCKVLNPEIPRFNTVYSGKNFERKNVGISKFISFLVSSWYVFNSYEVFTINVESLIFHSPKMEGKKIK